MSGRPDGPGTFRKRKSWSRYGVSDIIGNLLVLAITVTLFTGILFFVTSMPGPSEKVYTDFSPSLKLLSDSGDAYINITHKGGEPLYDYRTNIYLFVNEAPMSLTLADGNIAGDSWPTGATWSYKLTGVLPSTALSIMIVDKVANTVVFSSPLQGGTQAATTLPIIGDRGLTPSPAYDGSKVRFYVQISDPYGKLDRTSVFINAASIQLSSAIPLNYSSALNLYVSDYVTAKLAWDGATVLVYASDTSGHRVTANLVLDIAPGTGTGSGPYTNYPEYLTNGTYPPDASGGEAGGTLGITFYYIKRTSDGTITRDFTPGEGITIEVWSDTLNNVAGQNSFRIYHPLLGVNPVAPSSDAAFKIGGTFSTFRQFVFNFTAPADSYRYPIQMVLKDNQGITLNLADYINVNGAAFPQLETYVAVGNKLVRTSSFNHTDDLYLIIRTKDVDRYTNTVYISGIEVDDYTGSYVIMKSPPAVPSDGSVAYQAPLSSLYKTNGAIIDPYGYNQNNGVYTIKITLKDANQGWWLPRTNSYTLKITTFLDKGDGGTFGESYSQLSCQFSVNAPLTTTDVAAAMGSGSFAWSSSGATWQYNSIAWFKGGDQWNQRVIDSNPSNGPLGLYLADLTGDGRNDLVVGAQDSSGKNLFWYESLKADGSDWSQAKAIAYPFDIYPGLNIAGTSTDKGNANEDATIWRYSDGWLDRSDNFVERSTYNCPMELCTALQVADFDRDGRADVVASFIHVVIYTTASDEESANAGNSWGMFFNRGVYVFWNDGSDNWQRTPLYGTDSWITSNAANKDTNPAAADLAVADFNRDGYTDIVAVYEDGSTKVWLNQWAKKAGSFTDAFGQLESYRSLPKIAGNSPWEHKQVMPKVRAADMNGDGYPDIVRTCTKSTDYSIYIYYTQVTSPSAPVHNPVIGFSVDEVYGGLVSGGVDKLLSKNGDYQTLSEKEVLYAPYYANGAKITSDHPSYGGVWDNTGSPINNVVADDGTYYDVWSTSTMALRTFSPGLQNISTPIKSSYLVVEYKVEPNYTGTNYIEYSFDNGVTWRSTGIQPKATELTDTVARFQIPMPEGSSYAELQNLQVRFVNPANSNTVHVDYVFLEVNYIKTQAAGWIYKIPNAPAASQVLTIVGHVSGSEGFKIEYSPDNETWFTLGQITSMTDVTLSYNLTYTPNAHYYVRITDLDRSVTDTLVDVLSLDQLVISHVSPTVEWNSVYNIPNMKFNNYISGLAIGDMKKRSGVYASNEPNDIVVTIGGNTAPSDKLCIIQQASFGAFARYYIATEKLHMMCPPGGSYEIHGVEIGDLDGDQDLDIILFVGAQIGRTPGSGPSLWEYTNNQQYGSTWSFTENPISSVAAKGESVINVTTGYIDLTILLPILGMVAIVASSEAVGRWRGRKR